MGLTLDLPAALAEELTAEATGQGLTLPEYAIRVLAAGRRSAEVRTGADLVKYWEAAGVIGTRPDIADPAAHARMLRDRAERRDGD
jgi:hypothetical protein